jgi:hypothetical protein
MKKLMKIFNATKVSDVLIEMKELFFHNEDLFNKLINELNSSDAIKIYEYIYPKK